jgi:hypothetical protein
MTLTKGLVLKPWLLFPQGGLLKELINARWTPLNNNETQHDGYESPTE